MSTYKAWMVVSRAWSFHAANSIGLGAQLDAVLANEPIGLLGGLILNLLLDHASEDIAYMLIKSSRLAVVCERAGMLGDSVCQLVPNDINAAIEVAIELVAVAEYHL